MDRSLNPLAWRHKDVKRRTIGIGIFSNTVVALRLVRMLLAKQDEVTGAADPNQAAGKPRIT